MPAGKIRFVHEASTPKAREGLFAGCRDGRVAVLIGSTSKVGIGTNIQSRLAALFHVDPTWTAAAWEQRNGRAIRNGNQNEVVDIYSFVSRGTFDAYMFGTVERKSRGFEQLYRVDGQAREIEDIGGDGTLTFAELKAAAAGNDLLRRQHEVARRVRTLRLAHVTVTQNVRTLLNQAAAAEASATAAERRLEALNAFTEHYPTMGQVDPAQIAEGACTARDPQRWSSALGEWRESRVSVRVVDTDPGQRLELVFDYCTLWSEPLPGKVRRRGPAAVAAWVSRWVASWIAGLDAERTVTAASMAQWRHRATDARSTAEGVDLAEPAELRAARADLAEVDAAIAEAVRADTGGSVAA